MTIEKLTLHKNSLEQTDVIKCHAEFEDDGFIVLRTHQIHITNI